MVRSFINLSEETKVFLLLVNQKSKWISVVISAFMKCVKYTKCVAVLWLRLQSYADLPWSNFWVNIHQMYVAKCWWGFASVGCVVIHWFELWGFHILVECKIDIFHFNFTNHQSIYIVMFTLILQVVRGFRDFIGHLGLVSFERCHGRLKALCDIWFIYTQIEVVHRWRFIVLTPQQTLLPIEMFMGTLTP